MPNRSSTPPEKTPSAERGMGNRSDNRGKGNDGRDANQLAYAIVQRATIEPDAIIVEVEQPTKNPAAVTLGHLGGLKGGKARASKLTPEQRAEIARKAAEKRWGRS